MKSRKLTCMTKAVLIVALAIPLQLAAQHTHYTVTDLGTLGGTLSFAGGTGHVAVRYTRHNIDLLRGKSNMCSTALMQRPLVPYPMGRPKFRAVSGLQVHVRELCPICARFPLWSDCWYRRDK
jgi:hypothetical protein